MSGERAARLLLLAGAVGLPMAVLLARRGPGDALRPRTVEIHGRMPESGGWVPGELTVAAGESLHLRFTSDDVMHGFTVGRLEMEPIDVRPGEFSETTVTFTRPGRYVYYCTRWCGVNHWRMRGRIEVTGEGVEPRAPEAPLYLRLGIDLDASHAATVLPARPPSAGRGAGLGVPLPPDLSTRDGYRGRSPLETWRVLRSRPAFGELSDMDVWDLVALTWQRNTDRETIETGRVLYATNCAACHGETGAGDGVMAPLLAAQGDLASFGHVTTGPADFTDSGRMLGASPALLQGKILRGGMGTGMPYFGPILTDEESWAVADYLWTFQYRTGTDRPPANGPGHEMDPNRE